MTVLVADSPHRRILCASEQSSVETGGAGCGTIDGRAVVYAGGPGPKARHGATSFQNDPEEDARTLAEARRFYGDTIHVNLWWHLHPFEMPGPSGTDCATITRIYQARGIPYPLLMGIVCPVGDRGMLTLHLYSCGGPDRSIEAVPFEVVPDNDPRLAALLLRSTATLDVAPPNPDYWTDPGFQFYRTDTGRRRIRQEVAELSAAGFRADTFQAYPSQQLVIVARSEVGPMKVVLPAEYPLNAPRIFSPDGHEFIVGTLWQWNSDRRLVDLLRECCTLLRRHRPRFLSPTSKEPTWLRTLPGT